MNIRTVKSSGGIIGHTSETDLFRRLIASPVVARIVEEFRRSDGIVPSDDSVRHHEENEADLTELRIH